MSLRRVRHVFVVLSLAGSVTSARLQSGTICRRPVLIRSFELCLKGNSSLMSFSNSYWIKLRHGVLNLRPKPSNETRHQLSFAVQDLIPSQQQCEPLSIIIHTTRPLAQICSRVNMVRSKLYGRNALRITFSSFAHELILDFPSRDCDAFC